MTPSRALPPLLCLLLVAACGGDAGPEPAAEAAKTAAVEPDAEQTGAAQTAARPDAPPMDLPPPPSPAPALNRFSDECVVTGAPGPDEEVHRYAAVCFSGLLEVLRASLMPAGLTPEQVGDELDAAELAVNRLGLRQGEGLEPPALRATAAAATATDLLAALVTAVGEGGGRLEEVRRAAAALDGAVPLDAQAGELAAYFAAADRAVRPAVRSLGTAG